MNNNHFYKKKLLNHLFILVNLTVFINETCLEKSLIISVN